MSDPRVIKRANHEKKQSARYPLALMCAFLLISCVLAINPTTRSDWLLENVITVLALIWLIWSYQRIRLSNLACTLLFAFGVLHEIGAHYQYSEVPYDQWFSALAHGRSLDELFGFQRNQYDRLVHFLYGLLITPVAAEVITARVRLRGFWLFLLPLTFMMSHAVIYELIEWHAAMTFGEELGEAYLGTQGDVWDAQKDMFLATLGSLIALPLWIWWRAPSSQTPGRNDFGADSAR